MGLFDKAKELANAAKQGGLGAVASKAGEMYMEATQKQMAQMGYNPDGTYSGRTTPLNPTRLERLDPYKATPRTLDAATLEVMGGAPMFGKEKWLEASKTAPLVYACVVQAHSALFSPCDYHAAGMLVCFSLESACAFDVEYLSRVAHTIHDLKDREKVPAEAVTLVSLLRNERSRFVMEVPLSLTEGHKVWCAVHNIDPVHDLPQKFLPDNHIVPAFLREPPQAGSQECEFSFVNPKFYV